MTDETIDQGDWVDRGNAGLDDYPALAELLVAAPPPDSAEETYRLALESCARWLNRYRLSPAMRLRALREVVATALADVE